MASVSLRDRTALTRLMILRELHQHAGASLTHVARILGVTVQAVSAHARRLERDGLLTRTPAGYAPSGRGLQELTEGFRDLKRAVDETVRTLAEIRVTSARAIGTISLGEPVGLFMTRGELTARAHAKSPSSGRALGDASDGEEILVGDLAGLVALAPGAITLVRLPSPAEGGIASVDVTALAAIVKSSTFEHFAAHGVGARVLARRFQADADLVFAPAHAAFNAAELGLNVLFFVTGDNLQDDLGILESANERTLNRIPIRLLEAPAWEAAPRG